ncbi:alpha-1-antitrypsin-like protein CM55-MM [Alligator sinensis]|uniref:Thyroxine-binding globulin n=1 Tax=Alligator sinensis TaxID=38654 RepID=A0A1U7RXB8_ALLSI|nr:alpha-1-antitrypsin-like protein CM55-MM [Alligator sinensis]
MKSLFCLCFLLAGIRANDPCPQDSKYPHYNSYSELNPGVSHQEQAGQTNQNTWAHKIQNSICQFALCFYKETAPSRNKENVFFSPISITGTLAMLALGAKSETLHQILRGLGFNSEKIQEEEVHEGFCNIMQKLNQQNNDIELNMGNVMFVTKELQLLQQFRNNLDLICGEEIFPVNFRYTKEAEEKINRYVNEKTNGKIVQLVKNIDPLTEILLVSYIYFKAGWEKQFDPKYTKQRDFFVDKNTVIKVPMMFRMGMFKYGYDRQLSSTVVQMDYKGGATAFFVLPDRGQMQKLERGLSCQVLFKWRKLVSKRLLELYLPKFNLSETYELKGMFNRMGIIDLFTDKADLSGITGTPRHRVSEAIHKAMVKVHESGTEAAAGTAVEIVPMAAPSNVKFERPFLFFIQFENSVLFWGKILIPKNN